MNHHMELIENMSKVDLDKLPYGVIVLSEKGAILKYNKYEGNLASRDPDRVIGKSFFKDVAPCTDVDKFYGLFLEGVGRKDLHSTFSFLFQFRIGPVTVT
ncbi:MAG: photoactive yellow protein, partial [Planctomycetota bacterium]